MENYRLIWIVIGLPLVGFLIQSLCGGIVIKNMGFEKGKKLMGALAVAPIIIAFLIGLIITLGMSNAPIEQRAQVVTLFKWISLDTIDIPFEALVDPLSMTMVLIITGIGSLIHLYATGYMHEEKDFTRFFTYLNLFIAFMLVLVLGNNLPMLFIGWEGVGLCSYLLIGFWYKDIANSKAANKAFIVNRIGDVGLALGMFLLVAVFAGSLDKLPTGDHRWLSYDVLIPFAKDVLGTYPALSTAIALCLFVGAMGKSAQFPLYLWLPDAMAGPTPVSALIHAATMVTAGVFLLNRMNVFFQLSAVASGIVAIIGAITALFAALIAFGQTDIKKVLAYSTVSQLGYMFIACGVGGYWAGMFHVTTHAFFKALLFLGSGAVIMAMAHNQDMRNYGGLMKYIKITAITMLIGWVAIAGLPPLAGFFSKESILGNAFGNEFANVNGMPIGVICGWVGLFVAFLTAAYMTRMTLLTFFSGEGRWKAIEAHGHGDHHDLHEHHGEHEHHDHGEDVHGFYYTDAEMEARHEEHEHHHELDASHVPKEVPWTMWLPLVLLAIGSVVGGFLMEQNETFQKWLYPNGLSVLSKEQVAAHPHVITHEMLMGLSICAAALGILIGFAMYWKKLPKSEGWNMAKWSKWRKAAMNQFGYDQLMVDAGVDGGGALAEGALLIDQKVIDKGMVEGAAMVPKLIGAVCRVFQTGFVRQYALMTLVGTVALVGYLFYVLSQHGGPK